MPRQYKHLTPEERQHFVEHGWLRVPGAINKKYIDEWMSHLWDRLGWDEHDKSTWEESYLKMPRHREVPVEEFCPEAWHKICEIVGGEQVIDPVRDRFYGDQFHVNFGTKELEGTEWDPKTCNTFHTDNDYFRQFLDSGECALTIICLFTDCTAEGGATICCEPGIKQVCQAFYEHPEGEDSPFEIIKPYANITQNDHYTYLEGKAGDVIITHDLLPHAASPNRKHFARVITNPHTSLIDHLHLHREDGDYTLAEQVILHHLGRTSIPEYIPLRPRISYYPRNGFFKRARVADELERMIAAAKARGLPPESVGSIYQGTEEEIREHEKRNGYDKPWGPKGVQLIQSDDAGTIKSLQGVEMGKQIWSFKYTGAEELQDYRSYIPGTKV